VASLVVFSTDVGRLAAFYEVVFGGRPNVEPAGDIRIVSDREEVLIHSIPKSIADRIEISIPPAPRDNSPLKPVFDVSSLAVALEAVQATGGVVTNRSFTNEGITRHDVLDSDGNVIQLRCPLS